MNTRSSTLPPALITIRQQAAAWWQGRAPRERQALIAVVVVVALFTVWSLFIAPALRTLREAPAQLDRLDAQLQQVQRAAAESVVLRSVAPVSNAQASLALKAASDRLGDRARLTLQGDRASIALTGVDTESLRAWLQEARSGARARPVEAQLQRGPQGYSGALNVTLGGAP
ncbi:MAG: type II secretion system protein M [Rhizobacter sp.]|nr:type II secretion system protein M [Rhizobacter sp.]